MATSKTTARSKPAGPKAGPKSAAKTAWQKPRITRHGNMRQLTQMSG